MTYISERFNSFIESIDSHTLILSFFMISSLLVVYIAVFLFNQHGVGSEDGGNK